MDSYILKAILVAYVIQEFGERCPDYEESCIVCHIWKSIDYLFDF